MRTVIIFLTNPLGETLEDFSHDETTFVFDRLGPDGPSQVIDGPVWAFVDWVMDDMSGLEMCRRLRANSNTSTAHITMVLDGDNKDDRHRALKAGADDYMQGPLDRRIILDRVLALLSHVKRHIPHIHEVGKLAIDMVAVKATWDGLPIKLSPNEFRLLRVFAENADQVLSRRELIKGVGKQDVLFDERTVDVWVKRLRVALKRAGAGNPLRTIRSNGYVFDSE